MYYTLVLNASYEPLKIVTWERAITLFFNEKVDVLEVYEDNPIQTSAYPFKRPAVVRLRERCAWRVGHAKFSRVNLYLRDEYTCQYCGSEFSPRDLTFDHVMPRSRGGRTTWKNIVAACKPCNQRKGDLTPDEAEMPLIQKPSVPRWLNSQATKKGKHQELWQNYLF